MFLNKDKKSNYIFVFFIYILFFVVLMNSFLISSSYCIPVSSEFVRAQESFIEQRLFVFWGKDFCPIWLIEQELNQCRLDLINLLGRRTCPLIILRKHTSSVRTPDILRWHDVLKRKLLCCCRGILIRFVVPLKLICFNEKNNSLNQIYEQIKIIFTNTLNKSYQYILLNYIFLSEES